MDTANSLESASLDNSATSLRTLSLRPEYRSDLDNLVADFYVPCLGRTSLYCRAVGYFTSRGLAAAGEGIKSLIDRGGRMRLIASPLLQREDLEAIKRGHEERRRIVERALTRQLDVTMEPQISDRLEYLAWLIANNRLDVRIAIPVREDGTAKCGIYHEKLGLFTDAHDDIVAFTGSPNETSGGLIDNFETIDVFWSWEDSQGRVALKRANFERLWENRTKQLDVVDFPEATRRALLRFRPSQAPEKNPAEPAAPPLWEHQSTAVRTFMKQERGILEMATGTGKTRTALHICELLLRNQSIDCIIVSADGNDLLDQWHRHLLQLTSTLGHPFRLARHYADRRERDYFCLDPKYSILLASRHALPAALKGLPTHQSHRTFLIHDEVHRLGSPGNRASLTGSSDSIRFRVGLSATPEREYDLEGTEFITQHVGPVIYRFELGDAIRRRILSPFDYFPLEYVPDDNDKQRISQVYKRAAARKHAGQPMSREELWTELARVYKTSRAKLPVFQSFIRDRAALLQRCIIFVETQEYGEEVLQIVHRIRHDFHTYFSGEDSDVLRRFARGELQCLLTCHRLSEGIDIRDLRTVILFSSARTRLETIQRMGRCLRVNPADVTKRANVIDFIRVANVAGAPDDDNADQLRRDWLTELSGLRSEEPVDQ